MKNIAVLSTFIAETHAHQVIAGILECAAENDCNVVIYTCKMQYNVSNKTTVGEYMVFDLPDFSQYDGVIVASSTIWTDDVTMEIQRRVKESGVPAVSLERMTHGMHNVLIDNKAAMKELVLHMIQVHGHRRINYIAGVRDNTEAEARFAAYREALEENGIPYEPARVYWGEWSKLNGEAAVGAFMASDLPMPTAIICSSDKNALGAYNRLTREGIRVPEDIAITGFDDDTEGMYHVPALTSVARMPQLSGYMACQAILGKLEDADIDVPIYIKTASVFRESCGCRNSQPVQEELFRKLYFQNLDKTERLERLTEHMAHGLTMVECFEDLKDVLKMYVPDLACDTFHLFVFDRVLTEREMDTLERTMTYDSSIAKNCRNEKASLLLGYDNGVFLEPAAMDMNAFLSYIREKQKAGYYVFAPIHFADHLYGYCICGNSALQLDSEMFYTVMTDIGNAIETIKKQQLMQAMIVKLDSMWCYDALTGVYNRAGFKKYGGRVWNESIDQKTDLMLLFSDLNGLKAINDLYGHDEGDRCIKALADAFKSQRHHGEVVMRYGGDEFVVIAANVTEQYAAAYVTALTKALEDYNAVHHPPQPVSASFGYCMLHPGRDDSLEDAIHAADVRMYETKKGACKSKRNADR
ncbi:MAG: GGDEF domain-containing protein [Clostridia bacterium]|nr:GGDEF domain-containing protein [Clostridia bacterium]